MQLFFDILSARINLVLIIALSIIFVLRIAAKKNSGRMQKFLARLNAYLRRYHKFLGILVIFVGLGHGILSSESVWSFNFGTLCWVLTILLAVSWWWRARLKKWLAYHRILAILLLTAVFWHVIDVGGFTPDIFGAPLENQADEDSKRGDDFTRQVPGSNSNYPNSKLKDGVYSGTATGYRPGMVVQVTVTNGEITNVTVVSHNERDPRRYSSAMVQVPDEIVKKQSTNVDGVTGATRTSNGIKNAVNDALKQAIVR
jgi:uncharacterized protein with FMN-binding domain